MHRSRKVAIMLLISIFLSFNLFDQTAKAEDSQMKVTIDEGLNGKVKIGKGFPLLISVENSGEAFSGDLIIQFNPSWNMGGSIALHVDISKNSTKTYQISLPGLTDDQPSNYQNQSTVHLFKGDWRKGENIKFKGDNRLKPKFIDPSETVIGVLSENYDRLKELRILPSTQAEMIQLKKEELPEQGLGLELIDYLVIDEYAISQLEQSQQEAIKEWVESGGILIAGGAPNGLQSYGQLYSLLPMEMDKELIVPSNDIFGSKDDKKSFESLTTFTGAIADGAEVLQKSGGVPVTVKKPYGNGVILQTGFSLGDEPLSSWKGYAAWFDRYLHNGYKVNAAPSNYGPNIYDSLYWEFAETNEYFNANKFSIGQLIGLLVGYIVIIVPVLYFILRKIDKREHSWWIIPSLAFVMAAIVFGLGAKDRIARPQLNQMGVYKVSDHQLTGLQASSLLSNKSGEYTLSIPIGEFNAISSSNNTSNYDPLSGAIHVNERKTTDIVFSDVGYWSSKTIYGNARKKMEGGFHADITVQNKRLTGTIENTFDYDFDEIFIWSGSEKIKLGAIRKGETIKVDKEVKQSLLTKPYVSGHGNMHPNQNPDLNKMKKDRLTYVASSFLLNERGSENNPVVAGFTNDAIINVKMKGKKTKTDNINLIMDSFRPKNEFAGSFTLKNEMLSTKFNVITGQIFDMGPNGSGREIGIEDGEYEYMIQLPQQLVNKPIKVEELAFKFNNQFIKYSLLNNVTGEWLPIDQTNLKLNQGKEVGQYLSEEGQIILKLVKNSNGEPYVQLPAITIKGEVSQ
ncbi:hypothetical protein [Cytobacillus massiliigabonensis]|uniref:hypothetical protein n=1 Tax=Cytobacillus massiliigabonensis TaxID=1871011 RepID=UPI000C842AC5|nr:hypothetical protein [Cytobacillus massiliigabonensis]